MDYLGYRFAHRAGGPLAGQGRERQADRRHGSVRRRSAHSSILCRGRREGLGRNLFRRRADRPKDQAPKIYLRDAQQRSGGPALSDSDGVRRSIPLYPEPDSGRTLHREAPHGVERQSRSQQPLLVDLGTRQLEQARDLRPRQALPVASPRSALPHCVRSL